MINKTESGYMQGRVRGISYNVKTGLYLIEPWKKNLITTAGKVMILHRLGNIQANTDEGMIKWGAVGTGNTTTPSLTDTALEAELDRAIISYAQVIGTVLTLRVFFSTSQANGALKEFGWFGEDGTTLFNRINIDYAKTSDVTYTIEQEITLT